MNQPEELNNPEESFVELEQQLTEALRRVSPPEGFAERVMARAQPSASAPTPVKVLTMSSPRLWLGGAVAAALLTGVFVTEQMHLRRQRAEAELADRQFETAMRVTDRALEHAREQLQRAGIHVGN